MVACLPRGGCKCGYGREVYPEVAAEEPLLIVVIPCGCWDHGFFGVG